MKTFILKKSFDSTLCANNTTMGLGREGSIITLLVIDTAFFFLEIIVGYAVHSLALVAE